MGGASPLQGRLEATVSQEQLRDPVRARGEEAGGVLQHLTRVNPRKADLIKVSVPVNVTPNIHPRSEWYWGRRRQDLVILTSRDLHRSGTVGSKKATTTTPCLWRSRISSY